MVAVPASDKILLHPHTLGTRVLVVAPHPDDESIGCGGLIARLRRDGTDVRVTIVTDGSGSHPNSRTHPKPRLAALRAKEALSALAFLGVERDRVRFLRFSDRYVPQEGDEGFDSAVGVARAELFALRPTALVIPTQTDAHGDHRATAQIWRTAAVALPNCRLLEYLIWPGPEAMPPRVRRLTLDIAAVQMAKRQAIAAHRSQHGLVISDDQDAFSLPAELLSAASRDYEIFYEAP
jgi:LmbE family N-acetylglucosaminyl deacetylase